MKNKLIDSLLLGSLLITGILLCSLLITGCKNKDNDSFNSNNTIKSIDSNGVIKTETIETIDTSYLLGKTYTSNRSTLSIDNNGNIIVTDNNYSYKGFIDYPYIIFTEQFYKDGTINTNFNNYNYAEISFIGKQSLILQKDTGCIVDKVYTINNKIETTTVPIESEPLKENTESESISEVESTESLNINDFISYLKDLPNKIPSKGDSYSQLAHITSEIYQNYKCNIGFDGFTESMNGTVENISNAHAYISGNFMITDLDNANKYFIDFCNFVKSIKNIRIDKENLTEGTNYYIIDYANDTSVSLSKQTNGYWLEFRITYKF